MVISIGLFAAAFILVIINTILLQIMKSIMKKHHLPISGFNGFKDLKTFFVWAKGYQLPKHIWLAYASVACNILGITTMILYAISIFCKY